VKERSFIVLIDESAMAHSIEKIGRTLLALDGKGIHPASRTIDVVLKDLLRGVRDNVLLKTELDPYECEQLVREQLGRDSKLCTFKWVTSRE
jgi:hypothetical protein